jgi:thioredoxin 1
MNKKIILTTLLALATFSAHATTPGHPHYATSVTDFDTTLKTNGYVIVDFYANWCGPCRNLSPIIDEMAREFSNAVFVKVDIDQFNSIASRYSVRSIPTLIFFKNGKEIDRTTGFKQKRELRNRIQKNR